MEATISFDGEAALRIWISVLVSVSGRWHFEIVKSAKTSNQNPHYSQKYSQFRQIRGFTIYNIKRTRGALTLIIRKPEVMSAVSGEKNSVQKEQMTSHGLLL